MIIRLKSIAFRFTAFSFLLLIVLSVLHCNMRGGDILGMREIETSVSIMADSYWSDFNFTDSTGMIRCSVAVDFLNYTLKAGYHPDSLIINYTSEYPNLTLAGVKIFKNIYYQLTIVTVTGDSLTDTGSIITPPGIPPRVVESLQANSDYSGVYLEWQTSQSSSGYIIYRKEISGSTFDSIAVTEAANYFDALQSFARYNYTVRARNEFGISRSATPVTGFKIINLAPPKSLVASKGKHYSQIKLAWSPNSASKSSCIFRADSAKGPYVEIASAVSDSFYVDTVKANTFYFYKVSSQDLNGSCGPASAYDSGFAIGFLEAPEISDISEGHYENKIFIYWNSVDEALAYRVYRSEDINGEYKEITTTSDTFYVDYVNSTRNFYYEISTISPDSQEGPRSLFKAGYVTKFDPPELKVNRDSRSCILLYWDTIPGVSHYKIYRTIHLDSQAILIDSTQEDRYCDPVSPGIIWIYLMSAVNQYGVESRFGNAFVAEGPDLKEPEKLSASQGTFQAYVALSWSPVPGATGYHLYRATNKSASALVSSKIIDTLYIDSSAADTSYYRVCAMDSSGAEGYFSELVTGYPAALEQVKNLTGSADIPYTLQLTWDAVTVAESYIVYRSSNALSGPYIAVDTVYEPVYADSTQFSAYYTVAVKYRSRTGKKAEPVLAKKMAPPTGLNSQLENNNLKLMWNKTMGASSYNIFKSLDSVSYVLLKNVKDTIYYDSSLTEGTSHYKVTSVSINGETQEFSYTNIKYKNGVQNFTVTVVSDTLKLQWSKVTDADVYMIFCTDPQGYSIIRDPITDTFANFSFSESGTYSFRVLAMVLGYTTPYSEEKSGHIIARPLQPNLTDALSQTGSITLTWESNPSGEEADGYVIFRSTESATGYIAIDTITETTYTDTPPAVNIFYYYKIAGFNQSGVGEKSNFLYEQALSLPAPKTLSASNYLYGTHIALSWSKVDGAEKYIIGRASGYSSLLTIIDTCSDTFYNDSVATLYTTYYAIFAIKGTDTSSWSTRMGGIRLPPPSSLSASGSQLYISLTWYNTGNAPKFYVYRSDSNTGPFQQIDSATTVQYMDSVQNSKTYYYRVSSVNLNESELSTATVSAKLSPPYPPGSISATQGTHEDTIVVSWQESYGANEYELYRSTTSSFDYLVLAGTTTDTFFSDTVSSDSLYYYKAKAIGYGGESVLSSYTTGYRIPYNVPQAPTGLQSSYSSSYIVLYWNAPDFKMTPFSGYVIHRADAQDGPFSVLDSTSGTSFYDYAEKSYPNQYWYYVTSYNHRGESVPSDTVFNSRR